MVAAHAVGEKHNVLKRPKRVRESSRHLADKSFGHVSFTSIVGRRLLRVAHCDRRSLLLHKLGMLKAPLLRTKDRCREGSRVTSFVTSVQHGSVSTMLQCIELWTVWRREGYHGRGHYKSISYIHKAV